ncbi:MAG: hypothetical protein ACKOBG_09000 [Actinomycetota bacterium]
MTDPTCDNCGISDPVLVSVRRVYVVPETWDQAPSERVAPEPERWCVPCATQYPCAAGPD